MSTQNPDKCIMQKCKKEFYQIQTGSTIVCNQKRHSHQHTFNLTAVSTLETSLNILHVELSCLWVLLQLGKDTVASEWYSNIIHSNTPKLNMQKRLSKQVHYPTMLRTPQLCVHWLITMKDQWELISFC